MKHLLFISIFLVQLTAYSQTTNTNVVFTGVFGGTSVVENTYLNPTGSEEWAGFANEDVSLYPLSFSEDGDITFTGATDGTDVDVYFRFEFNPYPDTEPSFNTVGVTVSGTDEASYSIAIPAQGENTFSSFLLYVTTLDSPVTLTNITVTSSGSGCIDESLINPDFVCPTVIDYVCGCDGVTYTNACFAINEGGVSVYSMGECVNSVSVTFQVDMSQETVLGPVYITGENIDNWCGICETMDDSDGDGIYTYTTELGLGAHEYVFNNGGWDDSESLDTDEDGACTITTIDGDVTYVNRVVELASDDALILDVVCFNSCDACGLDPVKDDVAVTFSVDMTEEIVLESLYVTGASIDGWNGASVEMTDDNGDGVYNVTVDLPEGIHEYKFNNGGWDGTETLDSTEDALCTITTDGFTNRVIELDGALPEVQLGTVCFNSCEECEVENTIGDVQAPLFNMYPTVTENFATLKFHGHNQLDRLLTINDISGKMIFRKEISGSAEQEVIDVSSYESGLYILRVITETQSSSIRLIKSK
tara:strand:- start:5076 stop:6674 length:1599 start_codon:yes stop_codon:yes gene_type:complete